MMNAKSRVALVGALATALSLVAVAAPANASGWILGVGPDFNCVSKLVNQEISLKNN